MIKNAPGEELTIEDVTLEKIISKLSKIESDNLDELGNTIDKAVDELPEDWEEMDEVLEYNLTE